MQSSFSRVTIAHLLFAGILSIFLTSCSVSSAARTPTVTPVPTATETPTPGVTFVVAITPEATARPTMTSTPPPHAPTATPSAPYLSLSPAAGAPVARTIRVRGANLDPSRTVQLIWSPEGHYSPIATTAYTDRRGRLDARFHIPGSPPGAYRVMAEIDGIKVASARYLVSSHANLNISVHGTVQGETITVIGRKFLPDLHLVLIAYPLFQSAKTVVIGTTSTGNRGRFTMQLTTRNLVPGQYVLRSFSTDAVSAQMAEQFFEVVS